jgi:hypothetical protein
MPACSCGSMNCVGGFDASLCRLVRPKQDSAVYQVHSRRSISGNAELACYGITMSTAAQYLAKRFDCPLCEVHAALKFEKGHAGKAARRLRAKYTEKQVDESQQTIGLQPPGTDQCAGRVRKGRCYACGQSGHWSRECSSGGEAEIAQRRKEAKQRDEEWLARWHNDEGWENLKKRTGKNKKGKGKRCFKCRKWKQDNDFNTRQFQSQIGICRHCMHALGSGL